MWPIAREPEKVVAVARDDDEVMIDRVLQGFGVGRCARKRVTQAVGTMSKVFESVAQLVRDVMIKEEVHGSPGDICRPTRTSISPR
jgi:hypothetical protein